MCVSLMRHLGKPPEFIAVLGLYRSGEPHVLIGAYGQELRPVASQVCVGELSDWAKQADEESWQVVDAVQVLAFFTGKRIPIADSLKQHPRIKLPKSSWC